MDIIETASKIPGFTSEAFLRELHRLALGKCMVVEIGAFKGRSTFVLADAVAPDGGLVYSIDIWDDNTYAPESFDPEDGYKTIDYLTGYRAFLRNTRMYADRIVPLVASSHDTDKYFKMNSIEMLFLDGDHAQHMVEKDLRLWLPKCRPDAVICGDDYNMEGVANAVNATAFMHGYFVVKFDGGKGWRYTK